MRALTALRGYARLGLRLSLLLGALAPACEGDSDGGEEPGGGIAALMPGRWEALPPLPDIPRTYVGVAAARGKVFVVGGYRQPAEMVLAHAFDVATTSWEKLPSLPMPIPMPNVAAVGDRVFVLGGQEVNQALEWDFAAKAWKPLASLPVARGRGCAAIGVHGQKVLLAGGVLRGQSLNMLNTGERVRDLLVYDTTRDAWETWPEAPVAVGYAMGAVLGDQFYVLGGSYAARTAEVLVFDVKSRTWGTSVPLPIELSSFAAGVIGGQIVVTAGIASTTGMINPETWALNPGRPPEGCQPDRPLSCWTALTPIKTPRFATAGAVLDGRLYVPTGIGTGEGGALDFRALSSFEVFIPGR